MTLLANEAIRLEDFSLDAIGPNDITRGQGLATNDQISWCANLSLVFFLLQPRTNRPSKF